MHFVLRLISTLVLDGMIFQIGRSYCRIFRMSAFPSTLHLRPPVDAADRFVVGWFHRMVRLVPKLVVLEVVVVHSRGSGF